jgi:hypothetical protein
VVVVVIAVSVLVFCHGSNINGIKIDDSEFFLISKYADDTTLILEDDTQSLNHANFSAISLREQVNFQ